MKHTLTLLTALLLVPQDSWVGQMPVKNVEDYVFGFANINYDTTVVVSTDFNAAIPSKLGNAKATDKTSDVVYSGDGGIGAWNTVAEVEGVGGIKGFRCTDNKAGTTSGCTRVTRRTCRQRSRWRSGSTSTSRSRCIRPS